MKKIDQAIVKLAELHGVTNLSKDEIATIRSQLESSYLDSVLEGKPPFTMKESSHDNGKT